MNDNRPALCASLCCIVTAETPNNDGLFSSALKIEITNNLNKSNVYEYGVYMTGRLTIYRLFFAIVIVLFGGVYNHGRAALLFGFDRQLPADRVPQPHNPVKYLDKYSPTLLHNFLL